MCLALLALRAHPEHAVVIAANRDEYHARPASPAHWWKEGWLAGRDLLAGGTWLGVTRKGRFALVTNVRRQGSYDAQAPSRGQLVLRFLGSDNPPEESMHAIVSDAHRCNGFNLLGGDTQSAAWGSNRGPASQGLMPAIYGLSNEQLDTPWPKVRRSKKALAQWCESADRNAQSIEALFEILADHTIAPDDELPATGVGIERERMLSAPFIVSATYGTRNSTVITIGYDGKARLVERTFDAAGERTGEVEFRFTLEE